MGESSLANDIKEMLKVTEIPSPTLEYLEPFAAVQHLAFIGHGNVAHDTIFPPATPPTPAQVTATAKRHIAGLTSDTAQLNRFIQVVDPATGTVAGGAHWCFFASSAAVDARPKHVEVDFLDPATTSAADQIFAQRIMDAWIGNRLRDIHVPHASLDLLFTHPDYERRGIASMLVQWGVQEARRQGIKKCYVEASMLGRPMYEKNGFVLLYEVRDRWDDEYPDKGTVEWDFMERVEE